MLLVCIESEEVLLPFELQQPSLSVGSCTSLSNMLYITHSQSKMVIQLFACGITDIRVC